MTSPAVIPFIVALLLSGLLTAAVVTVLKDRGLGQHIREEGPESHQTKAGTPFMGGIGIFVAIALTVVLLRLWQAGGAVVFGICALLLAFALVGLVDDLLKARGRGNKGWKARYRLLVEFIVAACFAWFVKTHIGDAVYLPGVEHGYSLGWFFWPICLLAIVGAGNSVNLTDGLDSLAGGTVALCALSLCLAAMLRGQTATACVAAVIGGAAAGFLWFNAHPARIFMGDTGSLMLGAGLAGLAITSGLIIPFIVAAGVFIAEAASVIIQVISFQRTGKRVFRMSPLHHHFELGGWSEPTVVTRFCLAAAVLGTLAVLLASPQWPPA
ncbi:MAG: phospho-N-acetylmuramoyl-pentapeptide-transferase [Armatimonadota bacterium]